MDKIFDGARWLDSQRNGTLAMRDVFKENHPPIANDNRLDKRGLSKKAVPTRYALSMLTFVSTCFPETMARCQQAAEHNRIPPKYLMQLAGLTDFYRTEQMDAEDYAQKVRRAFYYNPEIVETVLALHRLVDPLLDFAAAAGDPKMNVNAVRQNKITGRIGTSKTELFNALRDFHMATAQEGEPMMGNHAFQLALELFQQATRDQSPFSCR